MSCLTSKGGSSKGTQNKPAERVTGSAIGDQEVTVPVLTHHAFSFPVLFGQPKRFGSKGSKLTDVASPSRISSDMA